jgi:uncharacterized membrane protein (UPF0182 family)
VEPLNFIIQTLLGELIVVIVGVLIAHFILGWVEKWRFGGWQVVVSRAKQEVVRREISARKAKEILEEPADLVVFLKGIVSPFEWIACDLYTEGQELGLLEIDALKRVYLINLDKNPQKSELPHVS